MSARRSSDLEHASILILKPSSLGDVVHTLPAVALVKKRWPGARVSWLINPEWAPLLAANPYVDEVLIFPRQELRGWRGFRRLIPWARELRERARAALVLDFQGLLRSALIARWCRAPGGQIIGLADAREGAHFFYDQVVPVAGLEHAVDRYLALARHAVASGPIDLAAASDERALDWPLPAGIAPAAFEAAFPFIVLHPFARGAGKSLALTDVIAFCDAVSPLRVVVAGHSGIAFPARPNTVNLLNRTTLPELIWLLRRAAFVVSVDSGPMHIAAALTPHLLSIHTWSDPRKVGPYRPEAWIWKDGALMQRQDIPHPERHQPATDLAAIAIHVSAFLNSER